MRAAIADLPTPHPVLPTLPGIYQHQPGEVSAGFVERFCGALDEVLSPVVGTLDNVPAYLDVGTAPPDFLPWLAHWLGLPPGPGHRDRDRRGLLRAAATQQGWQGTSRGIALVVETVFGFRAVVEESGGATWSVEPGEQGVTAGGGAPQIVVRLSVPESASVDEPRLDALVASLTPAHVAYRVEVTLEPETPAG